MDVTECVCVMGIRMRYSLRYRDVNDDYISNASQKFYVTHINGGYITFTSQLCSGFNKRGIRGSEDQPRISSPTKPLGYIT